MTDDFKNILFKYLTGSLEEGSPTDYEIFESVDNIPRSAFEGFVPTNALNLRIEDIIEVKNSDNIIMYGGYIDRDTNEVRGIIILCDGDMYPIRTYYEFNNGSKLRYIMCMRQDESGDFYFADSPENPDLKQNSFRTSNKLFRMVNNFAIDGSDLVLKKSYTFYYTNIYVRDMYKDPNSANYVFITQLLRIRQDSSLYFDITRVITLKINVGSSNEWKLYKGDTSYKWACSYAEFNDEGQALIKVILWNNSVDNIQTPFLWQKGFSQSSFTRTTLASVGHDCVIDSDHFQNQAIFTTPNEVYFVVNNQWWGIPGQLETKYLGLYKINLSTNQLTTIVNHNLGQHAYANIEFMYISQNQGKVYVNFVDNVDTINYTADYYFQRIENDIWQPNFIGNKKFHSLDRNIYIKNNYNLINIFLGMTNFYSQTLNLLNIKEIYNLSNYNGEPYESQNALIPHSATLYSNNNLVFARNLYNSVVQGATTISSVEVPNTYLNDTIVDKSNLIGLTNENLVKDTRTIEKNIYEKLDINFIDTLSIIDKNDLDNPILNPLGASLLNSRINTQNQFNDTKISKIVVNYVDETSKELGFEVVENGRVATYTFLLKTEDLEVSNIQFISNDGNIIYHTINGDNFELNKTYQITQEMEVI